MIRHAGRVLPRAFVTAPAFSRFSAPSFVCALRRGLSAGAAPAPGGALTLPPPTIRYDNLRDNAGARTRVRRKGRGVGSGHGLARSAGLGTRGQRSHGGGTALTFEGGQSPLWRRTPKFGVMAKMFREELETLNLARLQLWIDTGRLDATKLITLKHLLDSGCVSHIKHGVKLLAGGSERFVATGLNLEVTEASLPAIAAVEAAGGSVTSLYRTRLALHSHLHPERYDIPVRSPRPPPRKMAYYTDARTRGYLSSDVQLARMKAALARAEPHASFRQKLWAGGADVDEKRHLLDIDLRPWEVLRKE